ncbi:hypothetical protein H9Q73_014451, partial [Fusarium xylarioides]
LLALEQHKVAIDMANSLRVLAEIQLRRLPAKTSRDGLELPDRVHSGEVHSGLLPPEIDPPEAEDNVVFLTAKKARARLRSETDAPATPPVKRRKKDKPVESTLGGTAAPPTTPPNLSETAADL